MIITLENIYFSTAGLQNCIRLLAESFPKLYSELN